MIFKSLHMGQHDVPCECPREGHDQMHSSASWPRAFNLSKEFDFWNFPRGHGRLHSKGSTEMALKAKDKGIPLSIPISLKCTNLTPQVHQPHTPSAPTSHPKCTNLTPQVHQPDTSAERHDVALHAACMAERQDVPQLGATRYVLHVARGYHYYTR